jgi:hypothetical protein
MAVHCMVFSFVPQKKRRGSEWEIRAMLTIEMF